jgi:hypothetical protein
VRAGLGEFFLQLGQGPLAGGGARDEHEIAAGWDELLLMTENFAEAALGAVAEDGVADGGR